MAVDSGVRALPYHFAHHSNDPYKEAEHLLSAIGADPTESTVILDWEWKLDTIGVKDQANWIREFGTYFGRTILYCSLYPAKQLSALLREDFDLWVAKPDPKYNFHTPPTQKDFDDFTLGAGIRDWRLIGWQFSWHGRVPGINTEVDLDFIWNEDGKSHSR